MDQFVLFVCVVHVALLLCCSVAQLLVVVSCFVFYNYTLKLKAISISDLSLILKIKGNYPQSDVTCVSIAPHGRMILLIAQAIAE